MNRFQSVSSAEFPRQYVAADADFGSWPVAEEYYRELVERGIDDLPGIERWLYDWSELAACIGEERSQRYTAMTCQTDDPVRRERFLDFIENISPQREPWEDKLHRKFAALADRFELPRKRYEVLERSLRNAIELYREENIPLETEDEKLSAEYQQITGAMSCSYGGKELTLQQLALYLEETDRVVREEAWRLAADRFLTDAAKLDALYEKMVAQRDRMAKNAGFSDYRMYRFRRMERFDYGPEDCLSFHEAIERVVVPAARKLNESRRRKLGLETLRPWDSAVDAENQPPLRPFETVEALEEGCEWIFAKVHPEFGRTFSMMRERRLLDLGSRIGKAPGGYQATFEERRMPFVFMNAVGTDGDVRTLLHEGGHAFHTWACRNEPLLAYRTSPIEFAEVASMGMECLALPFVEHFYGADTPRAQRQFFEKIVLFFPYMARIDAFQHHVYTHVGGGADVWKDHWQALSRRFSTGVDWSGLEAHDRHSWHRKLHVFEVPFYYVEYGIAQLGALQVWLNSKRNFEDAVAAYRYALALGGSRPLPELFEAAGLKFDFSERTLRPLIDAVMAEIGDA